jgi:YHS domain-containing protein
MKQLIFIPLAFGLLALIFACTHKKPAAQSPTGFANETDYICGMKVQTNWTDTCQYKGKVYAFCGESCKEEFQANPESFLNKGK